MPENTDPLLPREAEESSAVVPRVGIGALRLRDHGDGAQVRETVKRNRLREGKEELSGIQDLH